MPVLFLSAFVNMVGFGMIFPLLPLFKLKFLLTDIQVGYIASIFAICGLFGTLFFGIFCDKYGRKYTMGVASILSGLVYFLTGYSHSFGELLVFRGLSGFLTSCFVICFVVASDISDESNKFRYMGIIGSAFTLGIIFGPALGGYLAGNSNNIADVNFAAPFNVAGAISLLAGLLIVLLLKETLSKEERKLEKKTNIIASLKDLYNNKNMVLFTYLVILMSLAFAGIEVYLSVWLNEKFGFTARNMGYYWGLFGLVLTFSQLVLTRFFNAKQSLITGFLLFGFSALGLLIVTNVYMLIILTIFMSLGMGIIFPSINVSLSLQGQKNEQGLIFGINQSFGSLGRIVGPYLLGLFYYISPNAVWVAITFICIFTATLIFKLLEGEPKEIKNEEQAFKNVEK